MVINKCTKCSEVVFETEDFLSISLEAFTSEDAEHIKNIRKECGGEPEKKKSWLKNLSRPG